MPDIVPILAMVVGAIALGGTVYFLSAPYLSGEVRAEKRVKGVAEATVKRTTRKNPTVEASASRRKAVADTLKDLEDRQRAKEKVSLRLRLQRAGFPNVQPNTFFLASGITGFILAVLLMIAIPGINLIAVAGVGFVGALGLPRWFLNFSTKRRQKKFLNEFANSIDVIVRGVKSGLPLNECLQIIARESPEPLCTEFRDVVEQQRVGVPLGECFERMIARVPLSEVKFFAIVIAIQQQAGGNLSEALGNLVSVLRDRKMMAAKVQALSAEAKASAYVLGSLPFAVMGMVYGMAPKYVALLFTTKMGNFLLLCGAIWMMLGVLVMRKMINFKY